MAFYAALIGGRKASLTSLREQADDIVGKHRPLEPLQLQLATDCTSTRSSTLEKMRGEMRI